MAILEFRPFKKLDDRELITRAYKKMEMMRLTSGEGNEETYDRESMIFNDMIKEIRLRKLRAEEDIFINILLNFHK